jgi:hypothetical protein
MYAVWGAQTDESLSVPSLDCVQDATTPPTHTAGSIIVCDGLCVWCGIIVEHGYTVSIFPAHVQT